MKRWTRFSLALALALPLTACAGEPDTDKTAADTPNPAAVGTAGTADIDRDFIQAQLADGQHEVELGRLAQQRASNARVKEFAQLMVRDHTQAGADLKGIASKHNVTMDTEEHADDHRDLRDRLAKLKGAEFDREYIDAMVDDHEKAVNAVEDKADDDNPEVKAWATKTLPTLRLHLERAKEIKESLDRRGTDNE